MMLSDPYRYVATLVIPLLLASGCSSLRPVSEYRDEAQRVLSKMESTDAAFRAAQLDLSRTTAALSKQHDAERAIRRELSALKVKADGTLVTIQRLRQQRDSIASPPPRLSRPLEFVSLEASELFYEGDELFHASRLELAGRFFMCCLDRRDTRHDFDLLSLLRMAEIARRLSKPAQLVWCIGEIEDSASLRRRIDNNVDLRSDYLRHAGNVSKGWRQRIANLTATIEQRTREHAQLAHRYRARTNDHSRLLATIRRDTTTAQQRQNSAKKSHTRFNVYASQLNALLGELEETIDKSGRSKRDEYAAVHTLATERAAGLSLLTQGQ